MSSIADEKYVALTTYKKDGTPVTLPVWIVGLGQNRVGFTTGGDSFKVKRIRRNPAVTLQACDMRGNLVPGSEPVPGRAEIGADYPRVRDAIRAKYGISSRIMLSRFMQRLQGHPPIDSAVEITLTDT